MCDMTFKILQIQQMFEEDEMFRYILGNLTRDLAQIISESIINVLNI